MNLMTLKRLFLSLNLHLINKALVETKKYCYWKKTNDKPIIYETSCENSYQFYYGLLNRPFKYCPYCGSAIKEVEIKTET